MFLPSESFGVNLISNTPDGELHRQRHFDICCAVNMTSLHVVLGSMVDAGHLSPLQRDSFCAQASGLLNVMLAENARAFIGSRYQSTAEVVRSYSATV